MTSLTNYFVITIFDVILIQGDWLNWDIPGDISGQCRD